MNLHLVICMVTSWAGIREGFSLAIYKTQYHFFNVWNIFEPKLYNQLRSQSGFSRCVIIIIVIVRRRFGEEYSIWAALSECLQDCRSIIIGIGQRDLYIQSVQYRGGRDWGLGRVLRLCIKLKETKKHFTTAKKYGKPIWIPETVSLLGVRYIPRVLCQD